jgi:hypothetical protein
VVLYLQTVLRMRTLLLVAVALATASAMPALGAAASES